VVEVVAEVPAQPSGLGWLPDGRLLVVSMKDRRLLRQEPSGELVVHADLSGLTGWPINDMVVDGEGRAYVGGFGFDVMNLAPIEGSPLYRVDPDGTVTVWGEDLKCPNGMAITPDGRTLVVSESFGGRMAGFDIGPDGALTNQRAWADFGAPDTKDLVEYIGSGCVIPDGIAMDAEGAVWIADALAGRAIRVLPGGEIVDEVRHTMPVFACALGGDDGRSLYLCSAPSFRDEERKAAREAELVCTTVAVPHGGRP
jgi:sugar lactone lactonase YvrE